MQKSFCFYVIEIDCVRIVFKKYILFAISWRSIVESQRKIINSFNVIFLLLRRVKYYAGTRYFPRFLRTCNGSLLVNGARIVFETSSQLENNNQFSVINQPYEIQHHFLICSFFVIFIHIRLNNVKLNSAKMPRELTKSHQTYRLYPQS